VKTKCIVTTSPTASGATVLDVSNGHSGLINGWDVYGAQFASGTQVTSSTSTTITIDTPTIAGLASGGNFTVTNVKCCII